jgi:hypothetical protein
VITFTRFHSACSVTVAFVLSVLSAGIATLRGQGDPPPELRCGAATTISGKDLPNPTTQIVSATHRQATPLQAFGDPALPAHCDVLGRIGERTGTEKQRFAINFRLRMPLEWNGRLFFEGGSDTNGSVGSAHGNLQGNQPTVALALGYAVVAQDSGHDNRTNNDPKRGGAASFGFDPEARLDFGYRSYDEVTRAAKAIVARHYGRNVEKSYFAGCGEGGREGMMLARRFPQHFDGILACAPGLHLPQATLGALADSRAFATVAKTFSATDSEGRPLLTKAFTDEDLALIAGAVLEACDRLDGLVDGLSQNFTGCTDAVVVPRLKALTCKVEKTPQCLSPAQVTAITTVMAGAKLPDGRIVYAPRVWDPGIGGRMRIGFNQGWRSWKLGNYTSTINNSLDLAVAPSATASIFTTPPTPVDTSGGQITYALSVNLAQAARAMTAVSKIFGESAVDLMRADSTDLAAFRDRGGKLIIVHGTADPVFSIADTVDWWNALTKVEGDRASRFARLYAVAGMNHCGGGTSTDQFNAFAALVEWVEKGTAPDRITATARAATMWPGRTRPLCPYPQQARYSASGSIEDAASFECRTIRSAGTTGF